MAKKPALDFEAQMRRLQDIVLELERPDLPLERSVALYKEGRLLSRSCKELLESARTEVLLCGENGTTPFHRASEGVGAGEKDFLEE
jgi:exodeoxyribonuclease VII small subunit